MRTFRYFQALVIVSLGVVGGIATQLDGLAQKIGFWVIMSAVVLALLLRKVPEE